MSPSWPPCGTIQCHSLNSDTEAVDTHWLLQWCFLIHMPERARGLRQSFRQQMWHTHIILCMLIRIWHQALRPGKNSFTPPKLKGNTCMGWHKSTQEIYCVLLIDRSQNNICTHTACTSILSTMRVWHISVYHSLTHSTSATKCCQHLSTVHCWAHHGHQHTLTNEKSHKKYSHFNLLGHMYTHCMTHKLRSSYNTQCHNWLTRKQYLHVASLGALRDCKQGPMEQLNGHFWQFLNIYLDRCHIIHRCSLTSNSSMCFDPPLSSWLYMHRETSCSVRRSWGCLCGCVYWRYQLKWMFRWNRFKAVTICRPLFHSSKKTCTAISLLTGLPKVMT